MRSSVSVSESSRSSRRTAASLAGGHACAGRFRLVDIEERRVAKDAAATGLDGRQQIGVTDPGASDDRDVSPRRLLPGQRHDRWQRTHHQRLGVELEDDRIARQLVGLAPARMQFADEADAATAKLDGGAAARVQGGMRRRHETGGCR